MKFVFDFSEGDKDIGLNDASVHGLVVQVDNSRFAWDSPRRLIQMFGKTVQHIEGERFEHALDELKARKGVTGDLDVDAADLQDLKVGVCGVHGGGPDSVHSVHHVGLNYVSCSPFRIPVARLEAARAVLEAGGGVSR